MEYLDYLDTLIQWPSGLLPKASESAYAVTLNLPVLSTKMSSGRKRHRTVVSKDPNLVAVPLFLSQSEKRLLDAFIEDKLNNGTEPFAKVIYWDLCDGQPCKVELATPSQPYGEATPTGKNWTLQLNLRILQQPPKISYDLIEAVTSFQTLLPPICAKINNYPITCGN